MLEYASLNGAVNKGLPLQRKARDKSTPPGSVHRELVQSGYQLKTQLKPVLWRESFILDFFRSSLASSTTLAPTNILPGL